MNILTLNTGSSSLKYRFFDMASRQVLCTGLVERIGDKVGKLVHKAWPDSPREIKKTLEQEIADHEAGLFLVAGLITDPEIGVVKAKSEIHAIGHRVVHGGESFRAPVAITDEVVAEIRRFVPLAPLHNPAGLIGIETAAQLFPGTPMVAVFDTAFHQTIPDYAYMFPVPYEYYQELGVRKYGFHGTSHKFVAAAVAEALGKPLEQTSVITCHLGNGCSMAAVKNGQCVDTTMGLTPLMGLMMGTRSGDIDPALHVFLARNKGMTLDEIDAVLNKQSGLKGICGKNDLRDIHALVAEGDDKARLALDMFAYRVKLYIGAYMAVIGKVDAIAFTAGVGENDNVVRAKACDTLGPLGAVMDLAKNDAAPRGQFTDVSTPDSPVRVLVVPTDEELEIATQTAEALK